MTPPEGGGAAAKQRGVDGSSFYTEGYINEDSPARKSGRGIRRTAATYSPTWWGSTIGDGELNFSVRNGKRWFLTAIATAIYYLRESTNRHRTISDQLRVLRTVLFLL